MDCRVKFLMAIRDLAATGIFLADSPLRIIDVYISARLSLGDIARRCRPLAMSAAKGLFPDTA